MKQAKKIIYFWKPALCLLVICVLCFLPGNDFPSVAVPNFDKLVHMGMFGGLSLFVISALKKMQLSKFKAVIITLSVVFILGGGIEILQGLCTKTRSASLSDLCADMTGTVLAILFYRYFLEDKKIEKLLAP